MVILIAGCSHTGKTLLAQKLLERYKYPYLSIDHLKMGLIRSGKTTLPPEDDAGLVDYLWPVVREIIKTAVENHQNLVIEGSYIPFDWKRCFEERYLKEMKYYCLIMTEKYIEQHWEDIKKYAGAIEQRIDDSGCGKEDLIKENAANFRLCREYGCDCILIDGEYRVDIEL